MITSKHLLNEMDLVCKMEYAKEKKKELSFNIEKSVDVIHFTKNFFTTFVDCEIAIGSILIGVGYKS